MEWEAGCKMNYGQRPGGASGKAAGRGGRIRPPLLVCFVVLIFFMGVSCAAVVKQSHQVNACPRKASTILAASSSVTAKPERTPQHQTTATTPETSTAAASYQFGEPVAESAAVSDDYFDDAVFIGNSITDTFMMYSGLDHAAFYAGTSMTVRTAYTKPIVSDGGKDIPIMDAIQNHRFQKVYIMFGFNELGWVATDVFAEEYGKLIDDVKKYQPDATIYVESILPVSKQKSAGDPYENNQNIVKFNGMIRDLAAEKKVYYLNIYEEFADSNGCLPDEASHDGVHFNKKYCLKWLDYLKKHTVD